MSKSKFVFPIYKHYLSSRRYCVSLGANRALPVNKSTKSFGQPSAVTHPHLIKPKELVPGVCLHEFRKRRAALCHEIAKHSLLYKDAGKKSCHIIIIPSATKKYMSGKIPYVFRQNSNFFYLTGCKEPDTVLVIQIRNEFCINSILFVRPKDEYAETWDGPRTGVENASSFFGVDESYSITSFPIALKSFIETEKPLIWYDKNESDISEIGTKLESIIGSSLSTLTPTHIIQNLRLYKSLAEQELMRQTCQIASESFNDVMIDAKFGLSEHHIFAMIDYKCRMRNADYLAYPPVAASGKNSTIIHYIQNSQLIKNGDMILLDAGCEYAGYSSDITRTWPIDGEFNDYQKILYDIVYGLQTELIDFLIKGSEVSLNRLFEYMNIKLGKYLQEAGLISNSFTDGLQLARAAYKFCPHHVSHYLGMDVHDTPLSSRSLNISPGMAFTIEPGIYVMQDNNDVPKEFRGMGIRIEDDILINSKGCVEVLTSACVKDRHLLQQMIKTKNKTD